MFSLIDYSHFTNFLTNRARANAFYTEAFGKTFQAYQGRVRRDRRRETAISVMSVGEDSVPAVPGRIDHVCFSVGTCVDRILARLTDYGLKPRENPRETAPHALDRMRCPIGAVQKEARPNFILLTQTACASSYRTDPIAGVPAIWETFVRSFN